MKTVWVGSEQRSDADWYVVSAFLSELNAKTWMYEASNRTVEEIEIADAPVFSAEEIAKATVPGLDADVTVDGKRYRFDGQGELRECDWQFKAKYSREEINQMSRRGAISETKAQEMLRECDNAD